MRAAGSGSIHAVLPAQIGAGINAADYARIDAFNQEGPCSGSRRMVDYLARDGIPISRDRVHNLLRHKGLRAIWQKPRTTVPGHPSERFTCLVDLSMVMAVDQGWATDITYIPGPIRSLSQ